MKMRHLLFLFLIVAMALLAACGEVVTPQPTVDMSSANTATSAPMATSRPTVTAPLLPPAPTATPTITPTPIIHVVQQGDTLQAIAFDYGVSVEALQRINGIESPQFLQVGQNLIIPVEEEADESAPGLLLPTPTPQPIEVQGVAFYETPVGSLWGLGEVVNLSGVTLTNVQVRVALFNAAGEQLIATNTFVAADLLAPGSRSPFGILFTTPPQDWANYQVSVIRGQEAAALADAYVPIEVIEVDGRPSGSQFQVSGAVQNTDAEQTAGRVRVIVTTYDAQGTVTGFRERALELDGPLAPGATASFSMVFAVHGDDPKDFNAIALGRIPAE